MMVKGINMADDTLRLFMEHLYLRGRFPSILFLRGKCYDSSNKIKSKGV